MVFLSVPNGTLYNPVSRNRTFRIVENNHRRKLAWTIFRYDSVCVCVCVCVYVRYLYGLTSEDKKTEINPHCM